MDLAGFRAIFPEFDAGRYPDARVGFLLTEANLRLLPSVWGELQDSGAAYYVAHSLALFGPTLIASAGAGAPVGAAPGLATGIVSSKSVGSVSKSYDTSVGQTDGGGAFNATTYGQTFLTLLGSVAVGARQF